MGMSLQPKKHTHRRKTLISSTKSTKVKQSEIKQLFIAEAKKIWENTDVIDEIEFEVRIQKREHIMGLSYVRKAKAIDNFLVRVPNKMTLRISPEALNLPRDEFVEFLRHEALHIGYQRHDYRFRELAKKHNIILSEVFLQEAGFKVQLKKGTRYETISVEETIEEARSKALKLSKTQNSKVRVIY
jgi:hypothetical protein